MRFRSKFHNLQKSTCPQTVWGQNHETLLLMTRHNASHTGLVIPSPLDLWINAMLRGLAMLVSFVRSICSMRLIRCAPACHSDATPEALPCGGSGKQKETTSIALAMTSSKVREGLMLRTSLAKA